MTCKSVDHSRVTAYTIHECDAATRMGSRPRRFLFTGHGNGSIQVSTSFIYVIFDEVGGRFVGWPLVCFLIIVLKSICQILSNLLFRRLFIFFHILIIQMWDVTTAIERASKTPGMFRVAII